MALLAAQKITNQLKKTFGKEFGEDCVTYLGSTELEKIPRLHSQCVAVDKSLGGGWPLGRICEVFGGESSGKTTLCYHAMAEAQKIFPDSAVGFVDTEHSLDPIYAKACGVDVAQLVISQPTYGEMALTMVEGMIEAGCKLVVLDSVAALAPKAEVEGEFTDMQPGLQARLMSKAMRKLTALVNKAQAVVIFTNQIREKIGVAYGNPECVTPDTKVLIHKFSSPDDVVMEDPTEVTMEQLFQEFGLDWRKMEKNVSYSFNGYVKIQSYHHSTNGIQFKKVLSIIRKDDVEKYQLVSKDNDSVILECSGTHRIWDCEKNDYVHVQDVSEGIALNNKQKKIPFVVRKTGQVTPIVDLEVEGNSNYFTNGILSHNTTAGGRALRYHASIRLKLTGLGSIEEGQGKDKEKAAIRVRCEAVKNKTAPPYRRGEYVIRFGQGIDNEGLYFEQIIENNLVRKEGNSIYYVGDVKINGRPKLKAYLEANPEIYADLKKKVDDGVVIKVEQPDEEPDEVVQDEVNKDESGEV